MLVLSLLSGTLLQCMSRFGMVGKDFLGSPGFPMLVVSITMTGSLLTSQSYTLECTVNVIDGLIQSPRLELMAPDGTSLALEPSGTTLTYTLSSLSTSDEGEYACTTILAIPGSGINRQASATASINVVGTRIHP